MPYSDPVADGPTIQQANTAALKNGVTTEWVLQQVAEMRKQVQLPIVLMGYLNPVVQFGIERFIGRAADAGVDGIILPDLPMREFQVDFAERLQQADISISFLVTPATPATRIADLDKATTGFVYAVSKSSTTGGTGGFTPEQEEYFSRLADMRLANPILVGFGVSDRPGFETVCRHHAGAIVGSAFIRMVEHSQDLASDISRFISSIKQLNAQQI
jgi:tryptophan synthase alpha chain